MVIVARPQSRMFAGRSGISRRGARACLGTSGCTCVRPTTRDPPQPGGRPSPLRRRAALCPVLSGLLPPSLAVSHAKQNVARLHGRQGAQRGNTCDLTLKRRPPNLQVWSVAEHGSERAAKGFSIRAKGASALNVRATKPPDQSPRGPVDRRVGRPLRASRAQAGSSSDFASSSSPGVFLGAPFRSIRVCFRDLPIPRNRCATFRFPARYNRRDQVPHLTSGMRA
jgi:hypothetical protein